MVLGFTRHAGQDPADGQSFVLSAGSKSALESFVIYILTDDRRYERQSAVDHRFIHSSVIIPTTACCQNSTESDVWSLAVYQKNNLRAPTIPSF